MKNGRSVSSKRKVSDQILTVPTSLNGIVLPLLTDRNS
jgi:hypothetical protein